MVFFAAASIRGVRASASLKECLDDDEGDTSRCRIRGVRASASLKGQQQLEGIGAEVVNPRRSRLGLIEGRWNLQLHRPCRKAASEAFAPRPH